MQVDKDKGFRPKVISEKRGIQVFHIRGTGLNNNDYGFVEMRGKWVQKTTSRGFTVVCINPDGSKGEVRFFDTYGYSSQEADFISYMRSLSDGQMYAIVTYDAFLKYRGTSSPDNPKPPYYSLIVNELRSTLFQRINFSFPQNIRTPWACVGVKGKAVMYESLGSALSGSPYPHAELHGTLDEVGNLGVNGFGSFLNIQKKMVATYPNTTTATIPFDPLPTSCNITVDIIGRIKNLYSASDTRVIVADLYKNGSRVAGATIQSNVSVVKTITHYGNQNDSFELRIQVSAGSDIDISSILAYAHQGSKRTNPPVLVNKQTMSCSGMITESILGVSPRLTSHFANIHDPAGAFELNDSIRVGDSVIGCTRVDGAVTSPFIEVDANMNYSLISYVRQQYNTSNLSVHVYFYDSNKNPTNAKVNGNLRTTFAITASNHTSVSMINIPMFGKQSKSPDQTKYHFGHHLDRGGIELFDINEKPLVIMDTNIKYIRYSFNGSNYYTALSNIHDFRYAFSASGHINGMINEL